jgi:hypothetical protein
MRRSYALAVLLTLSGAGSGCSGGGFNLAAPPDEQDDVGASAEAAEAAPIEEIGSEEVDAVLADSGAGSVEVAPLEEGVLDSNPKDTFASDVGSDTNSGSDSNTALDAAGADSGTIGTDADAGALEYTVVMPVDTDSRIYVGGFCSVDDRISATRPYPIGMVASRLVGVFEVDNGLGTYGEVTVSVYINAVYSGVFKFGAATGASIPINVTIPAGALAPTATSVVLTYKITAETIVSGCVLPKLGTSKITFRR